jgi:phosphoribosyl 1,2-cyclic phosphate phosphodiesterase
MQMLRAEVEDIECVFLTHEHNDHIIGLDDLRPFIFRHKKAIELYGLPRVLEEIEDRFKYAFINHPYPGAPSFKLKPLLPKEKWTDGNIEVEALQVYHGSLEILGYRIGDVAYLTDVKSLTEETFATLQGIPHLIISALRKERPHHSHLILDEALEIIQQINPDKAYLIHLSHLMGTHKSTEALLDKNVQIAYDGLVVET